MWWAKIFQCHIVTLNSEFIFIYTSLRTNCTQLWASYPQTDLFLHTVTSFKICQFDTYSNSNRTSVTGAFVPPVTFFKKWIPNRTKTWNFTQLREVMWICLCLFTIAFFLERSICVAKFENLIIIYLNSNIVKEVAKG